MTTPMPPPKRKDPTRRTRLPTRPPDGRSREALGLTAMAAQGRFALQVCAACGAVQYPPRQLCGACLADALQWRDVVATGTVVAETVLRHSNDLFFRERLPWRLGMVQLDCGPSAVAHLAEDCVQGQKVRLALQLDRSGQAVMVARPERPDAHAGEDRQLREAGCDPKGRRVLIVDGRTMLAPELAQAFVKAGARTVFAGHAEPWKRSAHVEALRGIDGVELVPLNVTDSDSVRELAALLGGKVEILVNNSYHLRDGGAVDRSDVNTPRDEMETHYLGLLRLAREFGPAMRARGADGEYGAVAWVNLLSVYALVNNPAFGTYSASQAAALSLSHCLRAELRPGGVRVLNAFLGPLEDEWHQLVPPPKLEPPAVARAVLQGLRDGLEELPVGPVAEEILRRLAENPKEIEREIGS